MVTIEEVLNVVKDAAVQTGHKANEVATKTKLKMEIAAMQKKQAATFEGIGRLVYDAHTSGEDIEDLKAEAFRAIEALQKEIDKLQDVLFGMEGAVRCKECSVINDGDAEFCKRCGNKL